MQIEVRRQVLDIWRSVIAYSYRDGKWHWGGNYGSNSISDAEQLLCILYPATNVPSFRFDRPDETMEDVQEALRKVGGDLDAPRMFVDLLLEYVERYSDEEGSPTFASDSYLTSEPDGPASEEQRQLEVVDSFSMSVTLMLAALGFIRVLRTQTRNSSLLGKIERLDTLASARLTAAMVGLLRSFAVNIFDVHSEPGRNLISMVNQGREPTRVVGERLSRSLDDLRVSLREELSIGSGPAADELESSGRLFECGWSWGVVKGAPTVEYGQVSRQRAGVAEERPYLYFTVVAMDGIEDLFSRRTRVLGLLDEDQQRLAQALQLRWDLTLQFWNRVAAFGGGPRWPAEDLPWRTSDGIESDYYSLLVASMLVQGLAYERSAVSTSSLGRLGRVFDELAKRGRITRRPVGDDLALSIHAPGMFLRLKGSEELGPRQGWAVSSFSSLLLKRVITVIGLLEDTALREAMTTLGDRIWEHLLQRRIDPAGSYLWDRPGGPYPPLDTNEPAVPSWYHTERVMECLVNASNVIAQPPKVSPSLAELAAEYLAEAEHLFDQEKLMGMAGAGPEVRESFLLIEGKLSRARELVQRKPGTAISLTLGILQELNDLDAARVRVPGTV